MAYFAEISDTNIVLRVLVVPDDEQHRGHEYLSDDLGLEGTWVETARAGVGMNYDPDADVFYEQPPNPAWVLDENFLWQPPSPYPGTDEAPFYVWDEDTESWVEVE